VQAVLLTHHPQLYLLQIWLLTQHHRGVKVKNRLLFPSENNHPAVIHNARLPDGVHSFASYRLASLQHNLVQYRTLSRLPTFAAFKPDLDFPTSAIFRAALAGYIKLFTDWVKTFVSTVAWLHPFKVSRAICHSSSIVESRRSVSFRLWLELADCSSSCQPPWGYRIHLTGSIQREGRLCSLLTVIPPQN